MFEAVGSELVRLWTTQRAQTLHTLFEDGTFEGPSELPVDLRLRDAYSWMAEQLRARCPSNNRAPLWASFATTGPDGLRHVYDESTRDQFVTIEFLASRSDVLISDLSRWCLVVSNAYVAMDEADSKRFEEASAQNAISIQDVNSRIRASWSRIFAVEEETYSSAYWGPRDRMELQACLWSIHIANVIALWPHANREATDVQRRYAEAGPGWLSPHADDPQA